MLQSWIFMFEVGSIPWAISTKIVLLAIRQSFPIFMLLLQLNSHLLPIKTLSPTVIKLLDEKGKPFRITIAFSGKKKIKGIEYTEDSINNFPPAMDTAKPSDPGYITDKIARYFDMDEFRLLIVANKYLVMDRL